MSEWADKIRDSKERFEKIVADNGSGLHFSEEALFMSKAVVKTDFATNVANQNPESLKVAMLTLAAIGLSLNPASSYVYALPRDGAMIVDVGYRGLIRIATDSGSIVWARADIVYETDVFVYHGPAAMPEVNIPNAFGDRGIPVGVYCIAKTHDGDILTEVMAEEELGDIKALSKAKNGAWKSFPGELKKKTVIKRASKTWPYTSRRLDDVIGLLNENEGIEFEPEPEADLMPKSVVETQTAPETEKAPADTSEPEKTADSEPQTASDDVLTDGMLKIIGIQLSRSGKGEQDVVTKFGDLAKIQRSKINEVLEFIKA